MDDHRILVAPAAALVLAAVAAEWALAHWRGLRRRPDHVLGSLWCALFEQALGAVLYAGLFGVYAATYERLALFELDPTHPVTWLVAFLAVDLAFYAYHRLSHTVRWAWALHSVHHQVPDLHLAAAVRNSPLGGAVQFPFQLVLAVLGVPPVCFLIAKVANPLYQLFVHTRLVGRLRWLDPVLNTPSNHRVHHGLEPHYRDHNYGGILMVWDRLFGTYQPELAEPTYGVSPALTSLDPIVANLQPIADLFRPRATVAALPSPAFTAPVATVALLQLGLGLAMLGILMGVTHPWSQVGLVLLLLTGGTTMAAWLRGHRWVVAVDAVRLLGVWAFL